MAVTSRWPRSFSGVGPRVELKPPAALTVLPKLHFRGAFSLLGDETSSILGSCNYRFPCFGVAQDPRVNGEIFSLENQRGRGYRNKGNEARSASCSQGTSLHQQFKEQSLQRPGRAIPVQQHKPTLESTCQAKLSKITEALLLP